ncbi:hypothetical protein J6590_103137, partial [Homalodisca vitripennis]
MLKFVQNAGLRISTPEVLWQRSGSREGLSDHDVCDMFVERFPNIQPPSRQGIRKLNLRFEETGSVAELPLSGRPRSVTAEENLNVLAQCFVQSPTKSQRKASN